MFPHTHFVFFTLFRTDSPYSSVSLSMARALVKTHPVLYVQHPYSWKDIASGLLKGDPGVRWRCWKMVSGQTGFETLPDLPPERLLVVQPPATLPINWLPSGPLYRFLQRLNHAIVLKSIRKALRKARVSDFVYINCYDPFFVGTLPETMGARLRIYHCIDDITQDPYTARHGAYLENEAVAAADLTYVTSTRLLALKKPFARQIAPFFNAADTHIFNRVLRERFPAPPELAGRPGPVIGFVGNLDALRIDYVLLKKVAEAHPDKTLLLVGPLNSDAPRQLGLDRLSNVVFAGSKPIADLPPYLQAMDVALIPFLVNTLTASIYPLKINEYLAAGKAVVATRFSEDIQTFGHCAYIAEHHDAFIAMIGTAIAENNPDRVAMRVATAAHNTWDARIQLLMEHVAQYGRATSAS